PGARPGPGEAFRVRGAWTPRRRLPPGRLLPGEFGSVARAFAPAGARGVGVLPGRLRGAVVAVPGPLCGLRRGHQLSHRDGTRSRRLRPARTGVGAVEGRSEAAPGRGAVGACPGAEGTAAAFWRSGDTRADRFDS